MTIELWLSILKIIFGRVKEKTYSMIDFGSYKAVKVGLGLVW